MIVHQLNKPSRLQTSAVSSKNLWFWPYKHLDVMEYYMWSEPTPIFRFYQ
jgi:hypothetical protein